MAFKKKGDFNSSLNFTRYYCLIYQGLAISWLADVLSAGECNYIKGNFFLFYVFKTFKL